MWNENKEAKDSQDIMINHISSHKRAEIVFKKILTFTFYQKGGFTQLFFSLEWKNISLLIEYLTYDTVIYYPNNYQAKLINLSFNI